MGKGGYWGGSSLLHLGSGWHTQKKRRTQVRRAKDQEFDEWFNLDLVSDQDPQAQLAAIDAEISFLKSARADLPQGSDELADLEARLSDLRQVRAMLRTMD